MFIAVLLFFNLFFFFLLQYQESVGCEHLVAVLHNMNEFVCSSLCFTRYLLQYQEPIPCEQVVATLCDIKQAYTQLGGECIMTSLARMLVENIIPKSVQF